MFARLKGRKLRRAVVYGIAYRGTACLARGSGGRRLRLLFGLGGLHAFAEARYMSVQTSGSSLNFVPITVGLMFGR